MNGKKLKHLFVLARKDSAPVPRADFAEDVLRAVRSDPPSPAGSLSVWDHLNILFPRLPAAAAAVIILCVAADWGLTAAGLPDVTDGAAQVTSQYFFNAEDL